jgi:MFS superfamily sulfate permease-like transporter
VGIPMPIFVLILMTFTIPDFWIGVIVGVLASIAFYTIMMIRLARKLKGGELGNGDSQKDRESI